MMAIVSPDGCPYCLLEVEFTTDGQLKSTKILFCPKHTIANQMYEKLKEVLSAFKSLPDDALGMEVIQETEHGVEAYPLKHELEASIIAILNLATTGEE